MWVISKSIDSLFLLGLVGSVTEYNHAYYLLYVEHVWLLFFDMILFLINSGIKDKNFMLHYEVRVFYFVTAFCMIHRRASCLAFKGGIDHFQGSELSQDLLKFISSNSYVHLYRSL